MKQAVVVLRMSVEEYNQAIKHSEKLGVSLTRFCNLRIAGTAYEDIKPLNNEKPRGRKPKTRLSSSGNQDAESTC